MRRYLQFAVTVFLLPLFTKGALKSELFSGGSYVRGLPWSSNRFDSVIGKSSGAYKVLFGHYSNIFDQIAASRREMKEQSQMMGPMGRSISIGKGSSRRFGFSKSRFPSFLLPLLNVYKTNMQNTMKEAAETTLEGRSEGISGCEEQKQRCAQSVPESQLVCTCHCLVKEDKVLQTLSHPIVDFVEDYCTPMGTVFEKIFQFSGKKYEQFRKFKTYLTTLEGTHQNMKELGNLAWKSVMTVLISSVRTDMMPLRVVHGELKFALTEASQLEPRIDTTVTNRLCLKVDGTAAMVSFVNIMKKKGYVADVLLRGLSTINLVAKYVPVAIQEIFASISVAIRIVTGTRCGLIQYAQNGDVPKCDQIGGIPVPGMPLPPETEGVEDKFRPECQEDASALYGNPDSVNRRRRKRGVTESGYEKFSQVSDSFTDGAHLRIRDTLGHYDDTKSRRVLRRKRSLVIGKGNGKQFIKRR